MSIIEEEYLEFTGDNWKDVLIFVGGDGEYVNIYSKHETNPSIENEVYLYSANLDAQIDIGDYVVNINGNIETFTATEWREYSIPDDVLEFERVVNVLTKYIQEGVGLLSVIDQVLCDISCEYIGKESHGIEFENKYSINGTDVSFQMDGTGSDRKLTISLL